MIHVALEVKDRYILHVEGHAYYDEPGKDIVCAGASMLCFTLLNYLKRLEEQGKIKDISDDPKAIEIPFDSEEAAIALNVILTGFETLSGNYPDYVQVDRMPLPVVV